MSQTPTATPALDARHAAAPARAVALGSLAALGTLLTAAGVSAPPLLSQHLPIHVHRHLS